MKTEAVAHLSLNYTRAVLAEHMWELWVYTSLIFGVFQYQFKMSYLLVIESWKLGEKNKSETSGFSTIP